MIKISHIPVLVVGGGAAGTMLALELARHGVAARVVDRLQEPSPYSRAIAVHARTLEMFELIDPKLAQRFLARGVRSPGYVMHFVDDAGRRREVRPGFDFRDLPSRYPFVLVHTQDATEATLRDYLKEHYGCEIEWGLTCTGVTQHGNFVQATLQDAEGSLETVVCQYLVACDGANSQVREQLGLAQDGSDHAGSVLQILDIELLDFPDDDNWIHYCMGPAHFVMVAKMQNGYARLLMSHPADTVDAGEAPEAVFGNILAQHFDGVRFGRTLWHSRWTSQVRLAQIYRKGNVFLAGDAAHMHSIAGGQGVNSCMQDAFNLGWKLACVLKEYARPELLDTYESECKPIGKQAIETAAQIHELFMAGHNCGADALLEMRESGFIAELVGRISGITYHYRHGGHAAANDDMPRVGERIPNPQLHGKHAGRVLNDLLRHGDYTLLLCAHDAHNNLGIPPRRGVVCEILAPAPAELLPASIPPQVYLVRPDGYIDLRCAAADFDLVTARLAQLFR